MTRRIILLASALALTSALPGPTLAQPLVATGGVVPTRGSARGRPARARRARRLRGRAADRPLAGRVPQRGGGARAAPPRVRRVSVTERPRLRPFRARDPPAGRGVTAEQEVQRDRQREGERPARDGVEDQ